MSLNKYIERIQFIDKLIRKRTTGNVEVLAKKLNLSKSGAEKFIHEMKGIGSPIAYNKKRKTYFEEMDSSEIKKMTVRN